MVSLTGIQVVPYFQYFKKLLEQGYLASHITLSLNG